MKEPKSLSREDVEELQAIVTERDSTLAGGLVKLELLESARTQNEFAYAEERDIFQLAAIYAQSIAQNHAFADANKRTALMAADVFLYENGFELQRADRTEHADVMVQLANKNITRENAAAHFQEHAREMAREKTLSDLGAERSDREHER
ncbi:MAG: type II toxin-antitoxin system death-on-curing family toxin [Aestuariivita sp.]|nr:type II toxin-antitoxin system death-on-curing family toxin [Aestuariivita sp.]